MSYRVQKNQKNGKMKKSWCILMHKLLRICFALLGGASHSNRGNTLAYPRLA